MPMGSLAMLTGGLAMQTGRPPVPMGSLARNVPGRGTNNFRNSIRVILLVGCRLCKSGKAERVKFVVKNEQVILNLGATLGVGLGVTNSKENSPDNQ